MHKFEENLFKNPLVEEISRFSMLLQADGDSTKQNILKITEEYNISIYDLKFLFFISFNNSPLVNQLAEKLGLTNSTVSIRLNSLEEKGMIERIPSSEDRRKKNITLTPLGLKIVNLSRPNPMEHFLAVLNTLSDDEKEILLQLVKKMTDHYLAISNLDISKLDKKTQLQKLMGFD